MDTTAQHRPLPAVVGSTDNDERRQTAGTDDPPPQGGTALSYVDLHTHLLPGIDDGAADLEATVTFAARLAAAGVRDAACTPHIKREDFPRVPIAELAARRADAQRALDEAGIPLRLHPGGELAHPDALALAPHELRLIAQGPAGARWLLVECPFEGIDARFLAAAARLRDLGYGLLLAHPERADGLLHGGGLRALRPLLSAGALLQVNVSSLLGDHGREAREAAHALVRNGLAHCLASDAHPGTREHRLDEGVAHLVAQGTSALRAERLASEHPRALLRHGMPRGRGAVLHPRRGARPAARTRAAA